MNLLKRKKTVDEVLSGFHNILSDLDEVAADAMREREKTTEEISRLRDREADLEREWGRAMTVHEKLYKLIGE